MPRSWQKVVYTPPVCITMHLPSVPRCFCGSIRFRGRSNTPKNNQVAQCFYRNFVRGFLASYFCAKRAKELFCVRSCCQGVISLSWNVGSVAERADHKSKMKVWTSDILSGDTTPSLGGPGSSPLLTMPLKIFAYKKISKLFKDEGKLSSGLFSVSDLSTLCSLHFVCRQFGRYLWNFAGSPPFRRPTISQEHKAFVFTRHLSTGPFALTIRTKKLQDRELFSGII